MYLERDSANCGWRSLPATLTVLTKRGGGPDMGDACPPDGVDVWRVERADPAHLEEGLLTLAVIKPTVDCTQNAHRLADRG